MINDEVDKIQIAEFLPLTLCLKEEYGKWRVIYRDGDKRFYCRCAGKVVHTCSHVELIQAWAKENDIQFSMTKNIIDLHSVKLPDFSKGSIALIPEQEEVNRIRLRIEGGIQMGANRLNGFLCFENPNHSCTCGTTMTKITRQMMVYSCLSSHRIYGEDLNEFSRMSNVWSEIMKNNQIKVTDDYCLVCNKAVDFDFKCHALFPVSKDTCFTMEFLRGYLLTFAQGNLCYIKNQDIFLFKK